MKNGFKILSVSVLFIVALIEVWLGCSQQQRTPRPADATLQTSFDVLLLEKGNHSNSYLFLPDENWQQKREVSFECFLLLSLSLFVSILLLILYFISGKYQNLLLSEYEIIFNK